MSNRFDDKFKNLPKNNNEPISEETSVLLNSGVDEEKEIQLSIDTSPLENIPIEKKEKRGNKTFYIDLSIVKELEQVAKNNKISSSKLLEHILKEVLKTD